MCYTHVEQAGKTKMASPTQRQGAQQHKVRCTLVTSKRERPRRPAAPDDRVNKWRAQPTALRIISALPDCNTLLYCCQANRITSERSASSRSSPQERTNATVSSAGRPQPQKQVAQAHPQLEGSEAFYLRQHLPRLLHPCLREPADAARSRCERR